MTITEIIRKLWDTGHFANPANRNGFSPNIVESDLPKLTLGDPAVREAIQSYQDFMAETLDALTLQEHGRAAIHDGHVGPATTRLFDVERCGYPDYQAAEEAGAGSWPAGCLPQWAGTHAVTVNFDKSEMPSFLNGGEKDFETVIWPAVVYGFAQVGLLWVREDGNKRANIQASWTRPDSGWIGLAIVPGQTSCNLSIWAKFSKFYQGSIATWRSLVLHELGHTARLGHTRGGIMNPSVTQITSWKGDPSESILVRYFGGVPVNIPTPGPEMWTQYGLKSDKGRELWLDLHPPLPVEG